MRELQVAQLTQSVEHETLNLRVIGLSLILGVNMLLEAAHSFLAAQNQNNHTETILFAITQIRSIYVLHAPSQS